MYVCIAYSMLCACAALFSIIYHDDELFRKNDDASYSLY